MKIETPKKSKLVWNYIFGKFKLFQQHKATVAYKFFLGVQGLGPWKQESFFDLGIGTSNGSGKFRALGACTPCPLDPPIGPGERWGPLSSLSLIIPVPLPFPMPYPLFPSPSTFPPPFPFSPDFPFPFPFPSPFPLPGGPIPLVQVGGLGSAVSSPSGSGRSPSAKRFVLHFELKRALLVGDSNRTFPWNNLLLIGLWMRLRKSVN